MRMQLMVLCAAANTQFIICQMNERTVRQASVTLAVVGIVISGTAVALRDWLFPDLTNLSGKEAYVEWGIRVIRDIGWMGAASVLLVSGVWLVRRAGLKLDSLGRLVLGVSGFLVPIGAALMFLHTMSKLESSEARIAEKLADAAKIGMSDQSMGIEERAKITRTYARAVWYKTGDSIKHIDQQGSVVAFVPTESEIQQQQEARQAAYLSQFTTVGMKRAVVINAVLLAAGIITGLLLPVPRQNDW